FLTAAGFDDARAVLERRAGAAYEPLLAELAARHFDEVLDDLDEAPAGQTLLRSTRRNPVATRPTPIGDPIKVGVIADQTGPLSFVGLANANVARMVVADVNFEGGLLGRPLELYLEDSATDDDVAAARATKLVEDDHVDVIFGGIYSSTRQAIKRTAVTEGRTLYVYPEQYEGQESDLLVFCTGPGPAQQIDPFIPWLMRTTGATTFYLPSADYIWPHVLNARVRKVAEANGGEIVGEEYYPLDHVDYRETVERITASGADVVFNTIVPPGVTPFFEQLHDSGFAKRGGQLVCTYFDENFLNMVPAAHVEGLYSCLDYYQAVDDPFSRDLLATYDLRYSGDAKFTGGSACSGPLPWDTALGRSGRGSGLARAGGRDRRPRSRRDRRRPRRSGRDGARPAPRAHEHVHRPGSKRPLRDRREPRADRSARSPRSRAGPHGLSGHNHERRSQCCSQRHR
ncbi:MAG TPA: substrate-binding protein, partial [Gaiellaceae bacterium]|nr:substrate-binding protein [Gaiellaceae bacterium]